MTQPKTLLGGATLTVAVLATLAFTLSLMQPLTKDDAFLILADQIARLNEEVTTQRCCSGVKQVLRGFIEDTGGLETVVPLGTAIDPSRSRVSFHLPDFNGGYPMGLYVVDLTPDTLTIGASYTSLNVSYEIVEYW